jgi:hypothetical protein
VVDFEALDCRLISLHFFFFFFKLFNQIHYCAYFWVQRLLSGLPIIKGVSLSLSLS